jgi:hypothetical protein
MFQKLKSKILNSTPAQKFVVASVTFASVAIQAAHATEPIDITTTMTTAFQSVVTQTLSSIAAIAPIGITIFAAYFVWIKGKQFFKSISK